MKVIKSQKEKLTKPITIEFSGLDAEILLTLLGNINYEHCKKAANTPYANQYKVTADKLDGFTDELFETLDNHVVG